MTSTIELERLVRPSDLHGRRGRHGRRRGWAVALTVVVVATITAVTTAIVA